jgi:hypothetical protein
MTTLRQALLPVADTIRALAGPTKLDIRVYTITVRTRLWSGGEVTLGTPTDTDLSITPLPKVRLLPSSRELLVGPMTPVYTTGGYTPAQLNPQDVPGTEFYYIVTGPDTVNRNYTLTAIDATRPFSIFVTLTPLDRKVPF